MNKEPQIVENRDKIPAVGVGVWVSCWSGQVKPWQGWAYDDGKCTAIGGYCKTKMAAVRSALKARRAKLGS